MTADVRCPNCEKVDYMPLENDWRRCWSCGHRWGPDAHDPGDPTGLKRLAVLLGVSGRKVRA